MSPRTKIGVVASAIAAAIVPSRARRTQALFETAIDAMLFANASGRYVDANPAASELLGYSHDEIVQKRVGDFTLPEARAQIRGAWERVIGDGKISGEGTIRRKDGELRDIEYRIVSHARTNLHCAIMHDISGRKRAERALQQLSGRLLRMQDEERRRIARQLHETTAQSLAALRLSLSLLERTAAAADPEAKAPLEDAIALADQSISEVRTLSYLLHPPLIDEAGLLPGLRWYVQGFQTRSGIAVTLDAPEDLARFPNEVETAIFRIVQESLTNIQRHSGSGVAHIRLDGSAENLTVTIEDKGHGLPLHLRGNVEALSAAGVGVAGMRERVRELGGEMQIESNDHGTRIVVRLPAPKESP